MHNLEVVAVLHAHVAKRRAGHDLEISLNGHAQGIEPKLIQHLGNGHRTGHVPVLAIDPYPKAAIDAHRRSQ